MMHISIATTATRSNETLSIARTSTVTLYRLAFLDPCWRSVRRTSDDELADGGVRSGDVRLDAGAQGQGQIPRTLQLEDKFLPDWFKPRSYRHFDVPVCEAFAEKVEAPTFVAKHSFSPLIRYFKTEKRYKNDERNTVTKKRPIMYASHRDACILSWYARTLNELLQKFYEVEGISDSVIAYRALGLGNYDFAADAFAYAKANSPVVVLAFDVSGFFDNLDHGLLKSRLKRILDVQSLSSDWYQLFRYVARFRFVERTDLHAHDIFGPRLASKSKKPIATIAELKAHGIEFRENPKGKAGIPQGTPISATLSNLYMIEFDVAARAYCNSIGGMYRRYSDDILVICPREAALKAEQKISELMANEVLELNPAKTERTSFDVAAGVVPAGRAAQYLGFTLSPDGAAIRASSLSRQWRKMRRAMKRTRKVAEAAIAAGQADRAFTKRLHRRFTALPFRNFSSYARRGATAFGGGSKIIKQVRKFERAAERELASLKQLGK